MPSEMLRSVSGQQHTHTHTHTRTHAHTHARTHTRTHAHTHAHTQLPAATTKTVARPLPNVSLEQVAHGWESLSLILLLGNGSGPVSLHPWNASLFSESLWTRPPPGVLPELGERIFRRQGSRLNLMGPST